MKRDRRAPTGTLFCLASGAAFGAMAVFGKLAYDEGATVGTLLAVRFTLAAALFWVLIPLRELRALPGRDVRVGLALGAGGYALQAGCYFVALGRIDASLLALLLYTFPALVAAAAVALGRERFGAPPRDRRLPRHRRPDAGDRRRRHGRAGSVGRRARARRRGRLQRVHPRQRRRHRPRAAAAARHARVHRRRRAR